MFSKVIIDLQAPYISSLVCNSITNDISHTYRIILYTLNIWVLHQSSVIDGCVAHSPSMPLKIVQHERKNVANFRPLHEGESRLLRALQGYVTAVLLTLP